jgi:hypothetical protein
MHIYYYWDLLNNSKGKPKDGKGFLWRRDVKDVIGADTRSLEGQPTIVQLLHNKED